MNKKQTLMAVKGKEFKRTILNFHSNDEIKQGFIKRLINAGLIKKGNQVEEFNRSFGFNQFTIMKTNKKRVEKGLLTVKSSYLLFNDCRINFSSINDFNHEFFKTNFALYELV